MRCGWISNPARPLPAASKRASTSSITTSTPLHRQLIASALITSALIATALITTPQTPISQPQIDTRQTCRPTVELSVAKKTTQRFVSRVTKLYEQGSIQQLIESDVGRWKQWAAGGLGPFARQLKLDDDVDGYRRSLQCQVNPLRERYLALALRWM